MRTVREPPRWFRGSLLQAYDIAFRQWQRDRSACSWKLTLLVPRMQLAPTAEQGEVGKGTFSERLRKFNVGDWLTLFQEAAENNAKPS